MPEAVRLVIWDLDETFWRGTLTEGGIKEYIQAHHDIVVALARRGILSSICSKNDLAAVKAILEEKSIWDYFIFPSVSRAPKGARIAAIVEAAQLRPATVLFVDDNPNNLAEAQANTPGLQVADVGEIAKFLTDPRFVGRDDAGLTRLTQYRLLEKKARDVEEHSSSNEDFLRSCNIRLQIEYDLEANIDRAIELINRTNQLNYTKNRLPDDPEAARDEFRRQMKPFDRQAGLVRVVDKYGDYGHVGFFMTGGQRTSAEDGADNTHLVHYCFSCRTLGMYVEQWVYEFLGRPELKVVGEVLTDLSAPRVVDWITLADTIDAETPTDPLLGGPAVVYGGCEANILGLYLRRNVADIKVFGNFVASSLFYRIHNSAQLLDMCDREPKSFQSESEILGLPMHLACNDIFTPSARGTTYFLHLMMDAFRIPVFRHKRQGWGLFLEPANLDGVEFVRTSLSKFIGLLGSKKPQISNAQFDHILNVAVHLDEHYVFEAEPTPEQILWQTREIIERVPQGGRILFAVDHDHLEIHPTKPFSRTASNPQIADYLLALQDLVKGYPFADVVSIGEVLRGPQDLVENHYARQVFMRLADLMVERAAKLAPRAEPPAPKENNRLAYTAPPANARPLDAKADQETVEELFQLILGRPINDDKFKSEHHNIANIRYWIERLMRSDEFKTRYLQRVGAEIRIKEPA